MVIPFDSGDATSSRALAAALIELGDVLVERGYFADAIKSYVEALPIMERLATSDNPQSDLSMLYMQSDLSMLYIKVGDVQVAQGDLAGALKSYRGSFTIAERLARVGWHRELSVAYEKIGDVQMAQCDLAGGRESYQNSFAIRHHLSQNDPSDTNAPRDLAGSLNKLGDVQVALGELAEALQCYREGVAILDRIQSHMGRDSPVGRELSTSLNRMGDVQKAQGDLAGALNSYRASLAIAQKQNSEREILHTHLSMVDLFQQQGKIHDATTSIIDAQKIAKNLGINVAQENLSINNLGKTPLNLANRRDPKLGPEPQTQQEDAIEFAVNFPPAVNRQQQSLIVEAWIFQRGHRQQVLDRVNDERPRQSFQSGGATLIARGARISVRLEIASCRSEPAFQTITWDGGITNVSFIVAPTDEFSGNSIIGWCIFSLNGSRIGQVAFEVSLRASGHSEFVSSAMVRRAFASYAHQDRREVLARVAGIEKVGVRSLY